jgi:hypothetical protein
MGIVLIIFTIVFVLGPIARAYADRLTRESGNEPIGIGPEVLRLREEVERLSLEVARLQDEQSFMVRLLTDGERKKLAGGSEESGDAD